MLFENGIVFTKKSENSSKSEYSGKEGTHVRYDRSVYKALTFFSQFTINMLVPIFMCSVAGYALDNWLGTSYLFVILFFIGALAGFRNVFLLAKRVYDGGKGDSAGENKRRKNGRDS